MAKGELVGWDKVVKKQRRIRYEKEMVGAGWTVAEYETKGGKMERGMWPEEAEEVQEGEYPAAGKAEQLIVNKYEEEEDDDWLELEGVTQTSMMDEVEAGDGASTSPGSHRKIVPQTSTMDGVEAGDGASTLPGSHRKVVLGNEEGSGCLLYTSPSPRDKRQSRMPSSA